MKRRAPGVKFHSVNVQMIVRMYTVPLAVWERWDEVGRAQVLP